VFISDHLTFRPTAYHTCTLHSEVRHFGNVLQKSFLVNVVHKLSKLVTKSYCHHFMDHSVQHAGKKQASYFVHNSNKFKDIKISSQFWQQHCENAV